MHVDTIRGELMNAAGDLSAALAVFASPANEQSLLKGIPNTPENHVRIEVLKAFLKPYGRNVVIRYRGPRRKSASGLTSYAGQLTCTKADGITFAVYLSNR